VGRRLLAIEARSAASWVVLVAAVTCGWLISGLAAGDGLTLVVPVAIACGSLLACATSSESPRGLAEREGWAAAIHVLRLAWPLTGCLAGLAAGFFSAGWPRAAAGLPPLPLGPSGLAAAMLLGSLLATGGAVGGATAAAGPVAAVGIGLALAGAAAATALTAALAISSGVLPQAAAALAAWMLLAAGGRTAIQDRADERDGHAAGPGWPAGTFAMPSGLVAAALGTSLAAMASCYFLVPQTAWLYAALATAWLLTLAVPPATAAAGGPLGGRLVRTAVGRGPLPGSLWQAASLTAWSVAFLGWPALVAMLVPSSEGPRNGSPLLAIACLVATAGLSLAAVAAAGRRGRLARAVIYAAAAAALAAVATAFPIGVEPLG
jgi:hypothetical protein